MSWFIVMVNGSVNMQTQARYQNQFKRFIWTRGDYLNHLSGSEGQDGILKRGSPEWCRAAGDKTAEAGAKIRQVWGMADRIPWGTERSRLVKYHHKKSKLSRIYKAGHSIVTTRETEQSSSIWEVEAVFLYSRGWLDDNKQVWMWLGRWERKTRCHAQLW